MGASEQIGASTREAGRWLRRHWIHFLIAPAMIIGFTTVHESAHALAVLVQGGDITNFVVWPSRGAWGFVSYQFPNGPPASRFAISMAPYAMWLGCMLGVALASRRRGGWPTWAASTMYLWGFVGGFGDITNAWFGWAFMGSRTNDLAHAFGPTQDVRHQIPLVLAGMTVVVAGYFVQKNLYRTSPLRPLAYAMLASLLVVLVGVFVMLAPRFV